LDIGNLSLIKQSAPFKYFPIVYDLIAVNYPHFVDDHYRVVLREYFKNLVRLADGFLCISEHTKADLVDYCLEQGLHPRAAVFPLSYHLDGSAPDISDPRLPDSLAGKSFVLYVSTIEARKNHRTVYRAWDHCMRHGLLDRNKHRLVFVGRVGWNVADLVSEMTRNPATRDSIVLLTDVNDAVLDVLYKRCAFAVYPSHIEGYGLPVVEALAKGKFCIVSHGVPAADAYPRLVDRLEARDVMAWARALADHLTDAAKVSEKERHVRAEFKPIGWDQAAEAFFSRLKLLLQ
jgi:glycosyltransferase involved in cell wall biosynthesis